MSTSYTPRPHSRAASVALNEIGYERGSASVARHKRHAKSNGVQITAQSESEAFPVVNGRRRYEPSEPEVNGRAVDSRTRQTAPRPKSPVEAPEETSFVAESSFVRAPLNSRLVNRPSNPPVPSSVSSRKSKGKEKERAPSSLHGVPLDIQEALVLEDLLYVLMGIPGAYITIDPTYDPDSREGVKFVTNHTLDPSLKDLVDRIIPLANHYASITNFVERRSELECGLVNHALCAAIREMLNQDYLTLVSQLEHLYNTSPTFSLQKLWFYMHPTLHTLALIRRLTDELMASDDVGSFEHDDGEDEEDELDEIDARDEELGLSFGKKAKLIRKIQAGIIKGGEVVAVLWENVLNMGGDPTAHALYLDLFRRASTPYAEMLHRWTTTGHLRDPYEEFMIKESPAINRGTLDMDYTDDYWERRYTLRDGTLESGNGRREAGVPKPRVESGRLPGGACVPPLLDQWKLKILLAGKYLNVIRECGIDVTQGSLQNQTKDDTPKEGAKQPHSLDDERFYQTIEDAYTFANRTLLQLLVKDQDLIPRLRSLKYYFFLSRSAYLGGFFENSRIELSKTVKLVSINKLQSLYDLALASSPGPEDGGFRGDMKLTMASSTLWDFLTTILSIEGTSDEANLAMGLDPDARSKDKAKEKDSKDSASMLAIDALALDYNVKFPLSLVISRKAILHYQLLFRFLLQLKNTEQALTDMWMEHKAPPWSSRSAHADLERWKMSVVLLRSQMLAFVQTILGYATSSILEATWKELEGKLVKLGKEQSQGTVDQLLRDHWDFLNTCMKGCLLTTAKFLRLYSSLLHTSTRFAAFNLRMTRTLEQAIQALADGDSELTTSPMNKRWDTLQKFQTHFQHHYNAFTDQVSYNSANEVALLPLAYRLNQGRLGDRGSGSLL